MDIKEKYKNVPEMADTKEEQDELLKFINDNSNQDFLEEVYLISIGYEGWVVLTNGKTVYISQPRPSAERMGDALKIISDRMRPAETSNIPQLAKDINGNIKPLEETLKNLSTEWNKMM